MEAVQLTQAYTNALTGTLQTNRSPLMKQHLLSLSIALATLLAVSAFAEDPKPEPFDLAQVRAAAMAYMESLQIPDKPYGAFYNAKGKPPTLYASCDAAITRTVMGEDLRKTLTEEQRKEWIDYINSFATPDGRYSRYYGHSFEHANGMVVGALGALGGRQKYPVKLYAPFDTAEEVGPWLDKVNWVHQWGGSHLFWGGMHCYSMSRRCTDDWRTTVFDWLDANLDPETGWWRKGVKSVSPYEPLGGAAHIWPMYEHHGRRFPMPEKIIDSILALQKPEGQWLGYGNYMDLDALYGLRYMHSLAPDYHPDAIRAAALKHGRGLQKRWPGILKRNPNLHNLLAAVGAFGLLQQLLPDVYHDDVKWTDIFSDRRLYLTEEVEVFEE